MSNQILSRDAFINEKYSTLNQNELNEGIFDFFKTLMKKEWNNVKSKNNEIKKKLEEADRGLNGFTLVKMKKAGQCAEIRQALCDFANTLWESKEKELEDGNKLQKMLMGLKDKGEISDKEEEQVKKAGTVSTYLKKFGIKDKALADNLSNYEKKITTLCKGDPDLTRWADLLKNDIRNIVNSMIIDEYDKIAKDEDKEKVKKAREELKKQQEEEKKKAEEKNKKAEKEQQDKIKEIEKERKTALSNIGVSPITGQTGDKAYNTLNTSFDNIFNEVTNTSENHKYSFSNILNEDKKSTTKDKKGLTDKVKNALGGDTELGLSKVEELPKINDDIATRIIKELKNVYTVVASVSKNGKLFKEVPSDSIQALFAGLSVLIQHAFTDGELNDDTKELLARCSISSDNTIGYGIPTIDPKKEDSPNIFVAITDKLRNPSKETQEVFTIEKDGKEEMDKEAFNKFKQNIVKMFDAIKNKAEEIKTNKEKEDEQEAQKAEKEDEQENKD